MLLKRKMHEPRGYVTIESNPIHVTYGVTVTSLFASPLQKIRVVTDRVGQIALNRKLSRKFEECCKVSSRVEEKWHTKRNLVRRYLPLRNICCFPLQKGYENSPKYYVIRTLQFFFFELCLLKLTGELI